MKLINQTSNKYTQSKWNGTVDSIEMAR